MVLKRYYFGVIKLKTGRINLSVVTSSSLPFDLKVIKHALSIPLVAFEEAKVDLGKIVCAQDFFNLYVICNVITVYCNGCFHLHLGFIYAEILSDFYSLMCFNLLNFISLCLNVMMSECLNVMYGCIGMRCIWFCVVVFQLLRFFYDVKYIQVQQTDT